MRLLCVTMLCPTLQQDMKHVVRSGTFCSLAAVGVSALGVKYLDELGSTVVHDNDPIALTSIFLMKLNQVPVRVDIIEQRYVMICVNRCGKRVVAVLV